MSNPRFEITGASSQRLIRREAHPLTEAERALLRWVANRCAWLGGSLLVVWVALLVGLVVGFGVYREVEPVSGAAVIVMFLLLPLIQPAPRLLGYAREFRRDLRSGSLIRFSHQDERNGEARESVEILGSSRVIWRDGDSSLLPYGVFHPGPFRAGLPDHFVIEKHPLTEVGRCALSRHFTREAALSGVAVVAWVVVAFVMGMIAMKRISPAESFAPGILFAMIVVLCMTGFAQRLPWLDLSRLFALRWDLKRGVVWRCYRDPQVLSPRLLGRYALELLPDSGVRLHTAIAPHSSPRVY